MSEQPLESKRRRGAPRKNEEVHTITAQLKAGDRELIERAALADDRSLSSFLRISMIERANRILGKSE